MSWSVCLTASYRPRGEVSVLILPTSFDLTNLTDWLPSWGPAPRFATPRTPERLTYGPVVDELATALKHPLYPSQRYVYDVALEVLDDGHWAYEDVVDLEPRRAGKTYKLVPLIAHRCSMPGRRMEAWLTAQDNTRAVDRWHDVAQPITLALNKRRQVVKMKISNTHEILQWVGTGSFFKPFAPGEKQMHGADPDLAAADELWSMDLTDKANLETAIEPAFSVKSGQFWKFSAAGTERSSWLNHERERLRESVSRGRRQGLAGFEWSIPEEVDGIAVDALEAEDLVELVMRFHPRGYADGLGGETRGLRREFLVSQLEKGRPAFVRNYGNLTQEAAAVGVFPADLWQLATWRQDLGPRIPDGARISLGVAVDALGRESSIVLGTRNGAVAVLEAPPQFTREGETWVAAEVVRLSQLYGVASVAVNYAGRSRAVGDQIAQLLPGVPLLKLTGPDYSAACARLKAEISEARPDAPPLIQHGSEPHLTAAMQAAGESERLKTGPVWDLGETREPIQALEAATVAAWAVEHMPDEAPAPVPFRIF